MPTNGPPYRCASQSTQHTGTGTDEDDPRLEVNQGVDDAVHPVDDRRDHGDAEADGVHQATRVLEHLPTFPLLFFGYSVECSSQTHGDHGYNEEASGDDRPWVVGNRLSLEGIHDHRAQNEPEEIDADFIRYVFPLLEAGDVLDTRLAQNSQIDGHCQRCDVHALSLRQFGWFPAHLLPRSKTS